MAGKLNLAILISGRGSNMQAIIQACQDPQFPARAQLVVSNKPDAPGVETARRAGIDSIAVDEREYADKARFEQALKHRLNQYPVDLICLAGFMRILSPDFIALWDGRIVNIHPSLLPAYKGLNTHQRVIDAGETESGCTVHFVTPELDAGEIVMQTSVPITSGDTPDTLEKRILEEEHKLYPRAIRKIAEDFQETGRNG